MFKLDWWQWLDESGCSSILADEQFFTDGFWFPQPHEVVIALKVTMSTFLSGYSNSSGSSEDLRSLFGVPDGDNAKINNNQLLEKQIWSNSGLDHACTFYDSIFTITFEWLLIGCS